MKWIIRTTYIWTAFYLLAGCSKNDPILFNSSMNFIAFSAQTVKAYENYSTVSTPIVLGATAGSSETTITVGTSVEGIENPAVEGVDYTISSKQVQTINSIAEIIIHPIDNADTTGDKSFYLFITNNSEGYDHGSNDTVKVTLRDDEHPLGKWIGEYQVEAVSYFKPGEYDEIWHVFTEADPANIQNLVITGIGADDSDPIIAKIDLDEMTISLAPGQIIGNVYANALGYGMIAVYRANDTADDLLEDQPLTGTIEEDGTIRIDLWAHKIEDGEYAGYLWDIFNTTWTKQQQ